MNSKTKLGLTITALILVVLTALFAIVCASIYGINKINNFTFSFKTTKINGFVQANYTYENKVVSMTTTGTEDGNTILNYNGETQSTTKELKTLNNHIICLSKTNNFVVFEYAFSNTNQTKSYLLYASYKDTQKQDENIDVKWAFSKDNKVENFDSFEYVSDFFEDPILALEVETGTTYLYIKAQVTNTEKSAEFSGDFDFQLIG